MKLGVRKKLRDPIYVSVMGTGPSKNKDSVTLKNINDCFFYIILEQFLLNTVLVRLTKIIINGRLRNIIVATSSQTAR